MSISMKYPHYYVAPCPRCGSRCTGRYIRKPLIESWYVDEQSLKNGEIIRFVKREPVKNCFCADCGYEWAELVSLKLLTKSEIEEEILARGTQEAYERIHVVNQRKLKKRQKNPVSRIFHFIFS